MLVRMLTALIVLSFTIPGMAAPSSSDSLYEKIHHNITLFGDIYREISLRYVDQIDADKFMQAGINGMLSTLDPYTVFIPEEDTEDLDVITYGKYGGVGIEIGVRGKDKVLTVVSAMDNSPAQRLGIRSGDKIIAIEGKPTEGMSTQDASRMLRGDADSKVAISIERTGSPEPIEFTISRQIIEINDVSYSGFVEPGVGYVKLAHFSTNAPAELEAALRDLKDSGMQALILDLRGNPGGLLSSAVGVLQKFVGKGEEVVSTRGRSEDANRSFKLVSTPVAGDIPLAVLVDGGSASASEIVAGAIQDLDRGVLIGEPSFGKGLVQSVVSFQTGEALKMTTAKYFTPSGRLIQKIDYFQDDQDIVSVKPAEILSGSYSTRNGRPVEGGGGIEPDIEIETPQPGPLGVELWRQGMFFDFANEYQIRYPNLTDAELNDKDFQEFRDWLTEKNFSYDVDGQSEVANLKKIISDFSMEDSAASDFAHLESVLTDIRNRDFDKEKDFILNSLESELANSLWGTTGRIEVSFSHDPHILKAKEVLSSKMEYDKLLAVTDSTEKNKK